MKKLAFIPDSHWPFHDKKAWAKTIQALKRFKPDVLVCLGDLYDFNSVSSHAKSMVRKSDRWQLGEELKRVLDARRDLESIGAKRNIYCLGNHEHRLARYISGNAPAIADMVPGVGDILGFTASRTKWEIIPYHGHAKVGKLYVTHDVGLCGKNSTRGSLEAANHNIVIGHNHNMSYHVLGSVLSGSNVSASFGWLGDPNKITYMHSLKVKRDWHHGFGVGYMDNSGRVWLYPVPIVRNKCIIPTQAVEL